VHSHCLAEWAFYYRTAQRIACIEDVVAKELKTGSWKNALSCFASGIDDRAPCGRISVSSTGLDFWNSQSRRRWFPLERWCRGRWNCSRHHPECNCLKKAPRAVNCEVPRHWGPWLPIGSAGDDVTAFCDLRGASLSAATVGYSRGHSRQIGNRLLPTTLPNVKIPSEQRAASLNVSVRSPNRPTR